MKNNFSSFSIIIIFTFLSIVGLFLVSFLNIKLTPSLKTSTLEVSFYWPNASPKLVEKEVTSKLEGLFNSIRGVKQIASDSDWGGGTIRIRFKKGLDMDAIRFEVSNMIRQSYSALPKEVSYPEISQSVSGESKNSILSYSVNSNQSLYLIEKYVKRDILPKLSNIDGVGRIDIVGANPYEWVIKYNSDKLLQLGINVDEILITIDSFLNKKEVGLGEIVSELKTSDEINEISVKLEYSIFDIEDWKKIPIKKVGSKVIYLKDIASLDFREGSKEKYYRINGLNTINILIYPSSGINTISLAKKVNDEVVRLQDQISEKYTIRLVLDSTEYLVQELNKIKRITFFSLLILILMAIVVYRDFKYLLILFLSILVNLLIAVIFYFILKIELQLYSFAGITISFGIILDNSIIMIDHLRNKGDKRVFLAILAATLTTIGSVLVVFLLEEEQKLNLIDFAFVITINIGVSLLVSLYFVPALVENFKLQRNTDTFSFRRRKNMLFFLFWYKKKLELVSRPFIKWGVVLTFVLSFGIPLHLLPEKDHREGVLSDLYNKSIGNDWFVEEARPIIEKLLGGTIRLFTENVFENSFFSDEKRTTLRVRGSMPDGATIRQLNDVVQNIEEYIGTFSQVELFETKVNNSKNSIITIYFKEKFENGNFPFVLKSYLEDKVVDLGGVDWSVVGVGIGFSNAVTKMRKANQIVLEGYNYDMLYSYAQLLKKQLIENSKGRVKEVEITDDVWFGSSRNEYNLEFKDEDLVLYGNSQLEVYKALKNKLSSHRLKSIINNNEIQNVRFVSDKYESFNVWDLNNIPIIIDKNQVKLSDLASIKNEETGNRIKKVDQQYRLYVAFDYIGSTLAGEKYTEKNREQFQKVLSIGFKALETSSGRWNKNEKKQYYYIFVIIGIVFFICSILLESIKQSLAIISMIPISFIGLFLVFYIFDCNFNQGGYASFILLCGISVNSALYIINEYNNINRNSHNEKYIEAYITAFRHKIIPVIIAVVSTIFGLLPFVWSGNQETFWFSFAVGSIGGLTFSLIGVLWLLPLFILWDKKKI